MRHNKNLVDHFEQIGVFRQELFVLIDVGCSGGISEHWRVFGNDLRAFGLDPQRSEIARLNREEQNPNIRYFPKFVGLAHDHPFMQKKRESLAKDGDVVKHFNVWNRLSAAYGVQLRSEQPHLREQSQPINEDLVDTDELIAVDDFVNQQDLKCVDFIKIDTDGTDFEVLISAEPILKSHQVLGFQIEVNFQSSSNETENAFHNIDRRMRELGYSLVDFEFRRYSRAALPSKFVYDILAQTEAGQPIQGDAVYARDVVPACYANLWGEELSTIKLLKLAAIYDLHGLPDLAAELICVYRDKLSSVVDVGACLDIITPPLNGKNISYSDYVEAFKKDVSSFFPNSVSEDRTRKTEILTVPEVESLREVINELCQQVDVYKNSRSWRITRPLRWLSKIIRLSKNVFTRKLGRGG